MSNGMDVVTKLFAAAEYIEIIRADIGTELARVLGERLSRLQNELSTLEPGWDTKRRATATVTGDKVLDDKIAELYFYSKKFAMYRLHKLGGKGLCYKLKDGKREGGEPDYLCKACGEKAIESGLVGKMVDLCGIDRLVFECLTCGAEI